MARAKLRLCLVLLLDRSLLNFLLKSVVRYRVQAKNGFVRILNKNVLAVIHLEAHVNDGADDTPAVVQVKGHLASEIARLVSKNTQDDVVVVVLGVGSGDESKAR